MNHIIMTITELRLGTGSFMVILCGFKSCQHRAKQFPSLSFQQQKLTFIDIYQHCIGEVWLKP